MSTPKQIAANRRNAEMSSGTKTTRGKTRIRLNASKQGMPANQVVLPGEDAEQYQSRLKAWTRHLAPTGPVELYPDFRTLPHDFPCFPGVGHFFSHYVAVRIVTTTS
jgi:hypothetical protein